MPTPGSREATILRSTLLYFEYLQRIGKLQPVGNLVDRDGLSEMARTVRIDAALHRELVGEELQRQDAQNARQRAVTWHCKHIAELAASQQVRHGRHSDCMSAASPHLTTSQQAEQRE